MEHIGYHYLLTKHSCILWFFWNWIYSLRILIKIKDSSITNNIFRIQNNKSIMCGFYCIAFMEYMLAGKMLLHNTNLFSEWIRREWQNNV